MSQVHPAAEELTRLLDGELTENRAEALRVHLDGCAGCREELEAQRALLLSVAAPVEGAPSPDALARLLRRVDRAGPGAPEDHRRAAGPDRRRLAVAGLAAVAVSLTLVLLSQRPSQQDAFTARGAPAAWSSRVGAELHLLGEPPRRLAAGSEVGPSAAFVGAYRNRGQEPAYLLAFAVDAVGELHWLYPAYLAAGTDPASVRLDPAAGDVLLPEAGALERPAPGPLRWFLVITRTPLHVSEVEALSGRGLGEGPLRARWPDASVSTLDIVVTPGGRAP